MFKILYNMFKNMWEIPRPDGKHACAEQGSFTFVQKHRSVGLGGKRLVYS